MPSKRSRSGNCCCCRIDESVVEGIQAKFWYRNKVQPESECKSSEHYRHRPSSISNSPIQAPVEPLEADIANHTAIAEQRHVRRQQMNSKFGRRLNRRKVDAKANQFTPMAINPNWKRLTQRNPVEWHEGIRVSRTTNSKSNRFHLQTSNDSSDHQTIHNAMVQSSDFLCRGTDCRKSESLSQSDLIDRQMDGQRGSAAHVFEHDTTLIKSNRQSHHQRTGQSSTSLDNVQQLVSGPVKCQQVRHSIETHYTTNRTGPLSSKIHCQQFIGRIGAKLQTLARLYVLIKWSLAASHCSKTGGTVTNDSQSSTSILTKISGERSLRIIDRLPHVKFFPSRDFIDILSPERQN